MLYAFGSQNAQELFVFIQEWREEKGIGWQCFTI